MAGKKAKVLVIVLIILALAGAACVYYGINHRLPFGLMAPKDPVIELTEADVTLDLGGEYKEPGFTAMDGEGNDITSKVTVSDTRFRKAGRQEVTYTVEDDYGNKAKVSRKVTVNPNTDYGAPGIAICMYHYVYDKSNPPEDLPSKGSNYIEAGDLSEEMSWLNEEEYYFPTWDELEEYIEGRLLLPEKSVVITFDDGTYSFLDNGIPVLEKYKVPATSFLITSHEGQAKAEKYVSDYVTFESHSDNMHRPGGNIGHGGIFTAISKEEGMADLKKSIDICGSGGAFCYPFGDYNDSSIQMVKEAGFKCAVTTEYGKAEPGMNPLLLPRIRMSKGQSLDAFISVVAPE